MKKWPPYMCGYFGEKTSFQRHLEGGRPETKQWDESEPPPQEGEIADFKKQKGSTLEFYIHRKFLTQREMNNLMKIKNKGKRRKEKQGYDKFLEDLRDQDCVPAMEAVVAGTFLTMRRALLARLKEQGIDVTTSPDTGR